MHFITRLLLVCLGGVLILEAGAQQPGLRRPSVKYFQINTDTLRIIYPEGMEETAQRVAQLATAMAREYPVRTGAPLRKIDMVLQNATDIPNGYVGLGPWRSELYLTPPQNSFDIGSLPWHDVLAVHEFRHAQQFSATKKGISSLFYYLFGEEAYSGAVHLAVPDWYTEGDAVVAETALTKQGRGRLPFFINGYREMVRDGHFWKYSRARNGSLRHYIPSHYPLGYLLVNYGREKYGPDFWDSIMVEGAAYRGLLYSFSTALKRRTGLGTKGFYEEAMNHYRQRWARDSAPLRVETPVIPAMDDQRYRDIGYPVFGSRGELLVMVDQFDRIPAICEVSGDELKRIAMPGFQTEYVFNAGGGKICWTELRRHPRWAREDHSVIVVYDTETRTRRVLTRNASYFMPAIAPDGKRMVAVHDNDFGVYHLHILRPEDGEIETILPNPHHFFYTHPQWADQGKVIISAVRHTDGMMSLIAQDIQTGSVDQLTEPSFAPIGRPCVSEDWVYFTRTAGALDEIFRVHRNTLLLEQLTSGGSSKYQPVIDPRTGNLLFTQFTLTGKKLMEVDLEHMGVSAGGASANPLAETIVGPEEGDMLQQQTTSRFTTTRYPLLTRPIRLHSWSVYPDDPVYGAELLSENTLNTVLWRSGWEYNQNSRFHSFFSELEIGLWYPEILAGYSTTRINVTVQQQELLWWQHNFYAGLRIPYFGYAGPYAQVGAITSTLHQITSSGEVSHFTLPYLSHVIQFKNARKQALQHPESRFSQSVVLRYSQAVDTTTAEQLHVETDFTFPSPFRNHLFWLEVDYRRELTSNTVQFADLFDYGRGYDPLESDDIWRIGLNYQFPLVYPDAGFAGIVYCKRIQLKPFFDYMRVGDSDLSSAGAEILFDLDVFNVEPVTIGLRWAKRLDLDQGSEFALILPTRF